MTVSHATLTGAELHEPKGIETATSGWFYVANGSGSGTWRALTYNDYPAGPHVIIEDQKTAGTTGQTLTANTDTQMNLNTVTYNYNTLATLSSNRFTLPAGTYYFNFSVAGNNSNTVRGFLYNFTDSALAIMGTAACQNASGVYTIGERSFGSGVVTIASSKTFELRGRYTSGGQAAAAGNDTKIEVYSRIEITKLL